MPETPLSAFRLTETDKAELQRIREVLDAQRPLGFRGVTVTDALRYSIATTSAHVTMGNAGGAWDIQTTVQSRRG